MDFEAVWVRPNSDVIVVGNSGAVVRVDKAPPEIAAEDDAAAEDEPGPQSVWRRLTKFFGQT